MKAFKGIESKEWKKRGDGQRESQWKKPRFVEEREMLIGGNTKIIIP